MTPAQFITDKLRALSPVSLAVQDESAQHAGHAEAGNGAHLRLHIVSEKFAGLSPLARHRLVYQTVGSFTHAGIHALAVAAFAPGETTKEKS